MIETQHQKFFGKNPIKTYICERANNIALTSSDHHIPVYSSPSTLIAPVAESNSMSLLLASNTPISTATNSYYINLSYI
jgi:hypothetical protein